MDSNTRDGSCDNPSSPPARSGPGNPNSIITSQFAAHSDITASPQRLPTEVTRPSTSSSNSYSSSAYLNTPATHSAYLPTPAAQPYSPFPVLSPSVLSSTWSQPDSIPEDSIPILSHRQSLRSSLQQQAPRFHQAEQPSNMSAVAIQYDSSFSMGPRSAFTWPGPLESHSSSTALGNALSSMGHGSEPSLTPPMGTRSLTSSPPRFSLTAEQRELKRQQDKARRDSRLMSRVRRTSSPPSYVDSPSSAMPLPDTSSAMSLPAYTSAAAPVSLMTEPVTSMSTSPYLPSYSPSVDEQSAQATPLYTNSYPQTMQHNYTMPIDYAAIYAGQGHYSTRPASLPVSQDVGLMYQVPAVMASGGASSQEGGHVRVVQSRPKPRCWEHGCNGRQFSTFSNLLRHQREKSGQAAKASCPNCGAEFTRTTARNGHLLHDKCKGRRNT
ncbi:hypothetical protein EDB81DRAFT_753559 [Dactylonectria macrodidyma]|uniref:Uncharacterized protein n=1 Tax=Dactylonectria macrodidyma TaxID=307937 RepID=A0A9P9FQW8_9HYPO|nr:hypothetical protein EDB81DRAFT_753559 [Dactylonectria macrodidyma]